MALRERLFVSIASLLLSSATDSHGATCVCKAKWSWGSCVNVSGCSKVPCESNGTTVYKSWCYVANPGCREAEGTGIWSYCEKPCRDISFESDDPLCFSNVTWAMQTGIKLFPQYYVNYTSLNANSPRIDFQCALASMTWTDVTENGRFHPYICPKPCSSGMSRCFHPDPQGIAARRQWQDMMIDLVMICLGFAFGFLLLGLIAYYLVVVKKDEKRGLKYFYIAICTEEPGSGKERDFATKPLTTPEPAKETVHAKLVPLNPRVAPRPNGFKKSEAPEHPMATKINELDSEYTVVLSRSDPYDAGRLLRVEGEFFIVDPEQAKIKDWNENNLKKQVRSGDQITLVNGYEAHLYNWPLDTAIQPDFPVEDKNFVKLRLKRRTEFTVEYDHSGILGLKVNKDTVTIKEILDGLIKDHNLRTKNKAEVAYPNDQIIGINNARHDKPLLLKMLRDHRDHKNAYGKFTLTFRRPRVE